MSYVANIEATFTPLFKVFLDHRDSIFGGGDPRIASLILWHFVEEIEHRSSGLIICDHLTPHRWSRTRHVLATAKHVTSVVEAIDTIYGMPPVYLRTQQLSWLEISASAAMASQTARQTSQLQPMARRKICQFVSVTALPVAMPASRV